MRRAELTATRVTLKVRFEGLSNHRQIPHVGRGIGFRRRILRRGSGTTAPVGARRNPVRLVGVRLGGLADVRETGHQLSFDAGAEAKAVAEEAVDQVVARFGPAAVQRGV